MEAPDITASTAEERRQYVKDRYPCLSNCEICGLCALFQNRDALDVYSDYIDGKRSFMDVSMEVKQGR